MIKWLIHHTERNVFLFLFNRDANMDLPISSFELCLFKTETLFKWISTEAVALSLCSTHKLGDATPTSIAAAPNLTQSDVALVPVSNQCLVLLCQENK